MTLGNWGFHWACSRCNSTGEGKTLIMHAWKAAVAFPKQDTTVAFLEQVAITCWNIWSYSNFNNSCIAQIFAARELCHGMTTRKQAVIAPNFCSNSSVTHITRTYHYILTSICCLQEMACKLFQILMAAGIKECKKQSTFVFSCLNLCEWPLVLTVSGFSSPSVDTSTRLLIILKHYCPQLFSS